MSRLFNAFLPVAISSGSLLLRAPRATPPAMVGVGVPLVFAGLAFAITLVTHWLQAGKAGEFQPLGVLWWAVTLAAITGPAAIIGRVAANLRPTVVVAISFAAATWLGLIGLISIAALTRTEAADDQMSAWIYFAGAIALWIALILMSLLVAWRMGRICWPTRPHSSGAILLAASFCATAFVPLHGIIENPDQGWMRQSLYQMASAWLTPDKTASVAQQDHPHPSPGRTMAAERAIFRQFDAVKTAAARLEHPTSNAPAVFFIGAAMYGAQGVFRREMLSVHGIVDEHLGTRGRSMVLLNDPLTITQHPMATRATIELAIAEVATKMRVDRDVLVLYLSSHGSPGNLAVSTQNLYVAALQPSELRIMLDNAGIKHRVVIISACYAGSFIEDLEGPDTLVITAARSDRTSFGCADENEWTYFGDAFFNQALRQSPSLIDAFGAAKSLIRLKETALGITASEPQIVVGANIRATLDALSDAR